MWTRWAKLAPVQNKHIYQRTGYSRGLRKRSSANNAAFQQLRVPKKMNRSQAQPEIHCCFRSARHFENKGQRGYLSCVYKLRVALSLDYL